MQIYINSSIIHFKLGSRGYTATEIGCFLLNNSNSCTNRWTVYSFKMAVIIPWGHWLDSCLGHWWDTPSYRLYQGPPNLKEGAGLGNAAPIPETVVALYPIIISGPGSLRSSSQRAQLNQAQEEVDRVPMLPSCTGLACFLRDAPCSRQSEVGRHSELKLYLCLQLLPPETFSVGKRLQIAQLSSN